MSSASNASVILGMPYIQAAQAQKHVTHNEALRRLDRIVQLSVLDANRTEPPAAPAEGDRHLVTGTVPGPATGAWAGQEGAVAIFEYGGWAFEAPLVGWRAHDAGANTLLTFDGAAWQPLGAATSSPLFGINATADALNRLTVSSEATLLNHAGAGHQLKLNKAALPDTASLLFQSAFSGRAEMGLAGEDAFSVKVSADGTTWQTALRAEPATGALEAPSLRAGRLTLASDSVATLPTPATGGIVLLKAAGTGQSGLCAYDSATPALETLILGPALDNLGTAPLTGTTGTPGRTSLAAAAGALLLENRSGSAQDYAYSFLSGL